jgi:hypothetical protein
VQLFMVISFNTEFVRLSDMFAFKAAKFRLRFVYDRLRRQEQRYALTVKGGDEDFKCLKIAAFWTVVPFFHIAPAVVKYWNARYNKSIDCRFPASRYFATLSWRFPDMHDIPLFCKVREVG